MVNRVPDEGCVSRATTGSEGPLRLTLRGSSSWRFEIRHEEEYGEQRIAAGDVNVGDVDAMLVVKDERRKKVAEFFEDADEHERPEAHGIRSNDEKHELPSQGDSGKAEVEKRMRNRRRILLANFVKDEEQRCDDENAPDAGDIEKNFGEFHGAKNLAQRGGKTRRQKPRTGHAREREM